MAAKPMKAIKILSAVALLAVCGLFVYAGAVKAWNPAQFAEEIFNYRLLPWHLSAAVALYLPWLELVAGASLLFRPLRRASLGILAALCLVFLVALLSALLRGINISCGCFGSHETGPGVLIWAIVRDMALLAVIGALLCTSRERSAE